MLKKILLFIGLLVNVVYPQLGGEEGFSGGSAGGSIANKSFWSVDLNGADEYAYRSYAAADSFLNMNGYERTLLPQSTMKVNNSLKDSVRTFTAANDTNTWKFYQDSIQNVLTGGKLQVALKKSGNGGIGCSYSLVPGAKYYVKLKARLVSGTATLFYAGPYTSAGRSFTFTPNSEERTIEGTFLSTDASSIYIFTTTSNGAVYEFDNIEVRELTNSVTNGTFTTSLSPWSGGLSADTTKVRIWSGSYLRVSATAASGTDIITQGNVLNTSPVGRQFVLTYQVTQYDSGSFLFYVGGYATTATRSAVGVYSDTLLISNASSSRTLFLSMGSAGKFYGSIDNIHLHEIPAYYCSNTTSNNHSVGWSKIDALVGAGDTTSTKIISTAAGDSVWQNVKLVAGTNTVHSLVAGNKYTIELWARAKTVNTKLYINPKGTAAKLSDSLSIIAGVWEKVVYNFTAVEACDTLKFWVNQADTVWIDSVNISQAYDFVHSFWVYEKGYTSHGSPLNAIYGKGLSLDGYRGYGVKYSSANTNIFAFSDSVTTLQVSTGTAFALNKWTFVTVVGKRDSALLIYENGVLKGSSTSITSVGNTNSKYAPLGIGWDGINSSRAIYGLIGEFRMTRFDNLGQSTWTSAKPLSMYNAYTLGNGFQADITGGGAKIVCWFDFLDTSSDANFLHDLSGNGYNLTGSNVTTGDASRWKR